MKKLFKTLVIVGLVGIVGIASAALVNYLSNTVTGDVVVELPIEQWISGTNSNYQSNPISFEGVRGGESVTFYVKTQNHANVAITGTGQNIVTSPGITCDHFFSVVATTTTNGVIGNSTDLIEANLCEQADKDGVDRVAFSYGPDPITWVAGQIDKTSLVVTFQSNVVGTYTVQSTIIPTN